MFQNIFCCYVNHLIIVGVGSCSGNSKLRSSHHGDQHHHRSRMTGSKRYNNRYLQPQAPPVFVINLDGDSTRLNFVSQNLGQKGRFFQNACRMSAVDFRSCDKSLSKYTQTFVLYIDLLIMCAVCVFRIIFRFM